MNMFSLEFLQNCFYLVFGLGVTLYAILDGFDLGVGMLHLFAKNDLDRRIFLNAIGPVWDGNAVWLVIVNGVLFAAFPPIFASMFSGFYLLCMILLFGLMIRAVAIEFRSKHESKIWRNFWDGAFSIASYIIAFGVGVTLGNMIEGVPINAKGDFLADFDLIFRPYPILIGLLSVSLFTMHGAIYLCMKTENSLHEQLRRWVTKLVYLFGIVYAVTTFATLGFMPHMADKILSRPYLLIFPIGAFLALLNVIRLFKKGKDLWAFGFSALGIASLFITFGLGTFPSIIRSTLDPSYSLTVYNSSSTALTLTVLFFIVVTGVPLVFLYGSIVYRIFKGKVVIESSSY
jgi:cytochrome d ubiquinol oxidase subunit II